jgi:hypothetical protein
MCPPVTSGEPLAPMDADKPDTCLQCGARLPPVSDAFCPECGERLDDAAKPSANTRESVTVTPPHVTAAQRQTRIMLGTMFGFLAGATMSFGCCGMLALSMFFGLYLPESGAEYVRLGAGVAFVAFTTWAGRELAKRSADTGRHTDAD